MTDTTTPPTTTEQLVDGYLAMWRESDGARRRRFVEAAFAPDGRHVDPLADARGHEEIDQLVAGVHAQYPGFVMTRTSGIDQHGDQLRFTWSLDAADGTRVVDGLDVAELAPDGRLARVAGFWGELPPT